MDILKKKRKTLQTQLTKLLSEAKELFQLTPAVTDDLEILIERTSLSRDQLSHVDAAITYSPIIRIADLDDVENMKKGRDNLGFFVDLISRTNYILMDETYPIECRYFDNSSLNLTFRNFDSSFSAIHVNTMSINNKRDDLEIVFGILEHALGRITFLGDMDSHTCGTTLL